MCFSSICLFSLHALISVPFSWSKCQGLAAACACGVSIRRLLSEKTPNCSNVSLKIIFKQTQCML